MAIMSRNYLTGEVHRISSNLVSTHRATKLEGGGDGSSSRNASLLTKAGFIAQLGAGLYTLLPLGLRVLNRIESIVRSEMNALNASEFLSPIIYPKDYFTTTGRWDEIDVLFKLGSKSGSEYCISATAEEAVTGVLKGIIRSYRDLPLATYQIQSKCRDELRPRFGLIRGREFRMKDLYSFHLDLTELESFYEGVCAAYLKIFHRCGIGSRIVRTFASGGAFSRFSDEFQMICESGEDTIFVNQEGDLALNKELINNSEARQSIFGDKPVVLTESRAIEVGNTFKLGTRFSDAFGLTATNSDGVNRPVQMCCYGIGTTRLVGAIAEVCNDDRGLIWPANVSPYDVHVLVLDQSGERAGLLERLIDKLSNAGRSVLVDDRDNVRAGEKLVDADLIGVSKQLIIGKRASRDKLELRDRLTGEVQEVSVGDSEFVFI